MQRHHGDKPVVARCGVIAVFYAITSATAFAHGPLHEQIAAVTQQIETNPTNAALYLKRGDLLRLHDEPELALADFAVVEKLDPRLDQTLLLRGKTLLAAKRHDRAKAALDRYLGAHPANSDALATRARVRAALGQPLDAAADFAAAIANANPPDPDLYRERAQLLAGNNRGADALRGLDEGIAKIGPIASLELPAIDLEIATRNFDGALARLDKLYARLPRKDTWLARRGEILEEASRPADALKNYSDALAAIENLPRHIRTTAASAELEAKVRDAIKRLGADGSKIPRSGK